MPSPTQITSAQLSRLIGTPHCPVLIDVSIDEDFNQSPYLIPGARRYPHTHIAELTDELSTSKVVVICQKGLKLSAGAAALLRSLGIDAEHLQGGNIGWQESGLPRVPDKAIPRTDKGHTLWVCAERPKIDRIACPWLIRRFVDPLAQFLYVPRSEVLAVADKYSATAFDTPGAPFSHQKLACTFDMMLDTFELHTESLDRLAQIVRAADTDNLADSSEAPGLLAMSLGLSRMFRNDLQQLDAGIVMYDALYRWARDAVNEAHKHNDSE